MSAGPDAPSGLQERVALAAHTTLGLGGPARYFLQAHDEDTLIEALAWAKAQALPVAILGGGSNIVAADAGFDGLAIALRTRGVRHERVSGASAHVTAAAGEPWDELVEACVREDLAGLECLSGIPGLVGATPIQNVGAYGQEVSQTITRVRVLERSTLKTRVLDAYACGFAYRDSALKRDPNRYIVLDVTFALTWGGAPSVRYAELSSALAGEAAPTLAQTRDTVIRLRRAKSMVLDDRDENRRSAGSFFLNPIVSIAFADALAARLLEEGRIAKLDAMPRYPADAGHAKLAAAWLIEAAGFTKGERRGDVGISTKHALSLTCRGSATTRDLLDFAGEIRDRVHARFGVTLEREPVALG